MKSCPLVQIVAETGDPAYGCRGATVPPTCTSTGWSAGHTVEAGSPGTPAATLLVVPVSSMLFPPSNGWLNCSVSEPPPLAGLLMVPEPPSPLREEHPAI